jgi:hypothetical protein
MCISTPRTPPPKPTIAPPPPPAPAPSELGSAIATTATALQKKKKGAKAILGRASSGTQTGGSSTGYGLKINN